MDVVLLSRLQFAITCFFHFLFVPLTLGLGILVAIMETRYVRTGDKDYLRMARFWGKMFAINFAIGVVTGITLEFQLGTNWSRYSEYVGDIFGSLLAIEATLAFFLESTFLAVWLFGWKRLSPRAHAASIWIVALASLTSAFWILVANAWMQHPVGYVVRNGRAELDDFFAIVSQPTALLAFSHTVMGAFILSGFFVMGVSAYHLLRKQHTSFFGKSFRLGMWFALIFSLLEAVTGHFSAVDVTKTQPAKLAAMESLWESRCDAPLYLFMLPDEENEKNLFEFGAVPPGLSYLAHGAADAEVTGLKEFPPEMRPPVLPVFLAFRVMVGLGLVFPLLSALGWLWRRTLVNHPLYLRVMLWAIPLPYIAIQAGWVVTEVGRQPWLVYGMMRTEDGASPINALQVLTSLLGFIAVYGALGLANFFMLARIARRGPEPALAETITTTVAGGDDA